jgi:hypothetical protein
MLAPARGRLLQSTGGEAGGIERKRRMRSVTEEDGGRALEVAEPFARPAGEEGWAPAVTEEYRGAARRQEAEAAAELAASRRRRRVVILCATLPPAAAVLAAAAMFLFTRLSWLEIGALGVAAYAGLLLLASWWQRPWWERLNIG